MSRLQFVKRGKIAEPRKFFFYGPAGLGKTSLAADAPNPVIIDIDGGSNAIDVPRYTFDDSGRTEPNSYAEFLMAIDDLRDNDHQFQTLITDTADKLEVLIHRHMLMRDSKSKNKARNDSGLVMTSIEDYGWGKGWNLAVDEWRNLLARFDELRAKKGMQIILVAHSQVKSFKNPIGEDYDRYLAKIHEKAFGVIKEWADMVGFMSLDTVATSEAVKDDRARGVSTGARVLYTQPNAAYEVKARGLMLADRIVIPSAHPWLPLAEAIADSDGMSVKDLKAKAEEILSQIKDEEYVSRANKILAKAESDSDRETLIKAIEKITIRAKEASNV